MASSGKVGIFLRGRRNGSANALRDVAQGGFQEIQAALKEFCDEMENEVLPEVMYDALEPTLEIAVAYAPEKTGALRESAYLDIVKKGKNPSVEIGFGRGGAPYAIYVHEMPYMHAAPTISKFLQVALDQDYIQILNRIVSGTREAVNA